MSTNFPSRIHLKPLRPGSGHDLFYKLGPNTYRLWDHNADPPPIYRQLDRSVRLSTEVDDEDEISESDTGNTVSSFAFEKDLQNYLATNLTIIEPNLRLYEDEVTSGIEFPAGGRFIDILAVADSGDLVVIELKVSKSYDRVIGQILRYMAWIENNMAHGKRVRGIIIGGKITEDLKLAASKLDNIKLFEYELSIHLHPVLL